MQELHPGYDGRVLFIPQRGCFARGIYVTAYAKCVLRPIGLESNVKTVLR